MENDKFLGIDGIPIEFYKEFIETVKKDLQKTFHEILFTNKITPKTWIQAIITLIPKKGDTNFLKYWRRISLLCVDYKVLTKILANRLEYILPDIISTEQNCSIPNRTIFDNLFLIRDIITYTKQKKQLFLFTTNRPIESFWQNRQSISIQNSGKDGIFPTIHKLPSNTLQTKHIYDNEQ